MDGLEIRVPGIHGRGVFATRAFATGCTVERCPVVVVPAAERHLLDSTNLFNYYFHWEGNAAAIVLGYGSLYNHSSPSARYRKVYHSSRKCSSHAMAQATRTLWRTRAVRRLTGRCSGSRTWWPHALAPADSASFASSATRRCCCAMVFSRCSPTLTSCTVGSAPTLDTA